MAADSKIEWCDHTFNPWIGCTKVSIAATGGGGCDHCYAEASTPVRVLRSKGEETWGAHAPRVRTSTGNWALPKRWNAQAESFCAQHGRRQRVFCASLADWLDNAVDIEWLIDLLTVVRLTPELDWLMLSKRIGNLRTRLEQAAAALRDRIERASEATVAVLRWIERWLAGDAPANVWVGATVVNQAEADRDIPKLLDVPARIRFLSMEPMLEAVNISDIPDPEGGICLKPLVGLRWVSLGNGRVGCRPEQINRIHWVIVGGESGPRARPMHPDWARSVRNQCLAAGAPFLFKQWGEWKPIDEWNPRLPHKQLAIKRDGSPVADDDAPQDVGGHRFEMAGKKAAGRQVDGREWNEVPL